MRVLLRLNALVHTSHLYFLAGALFEGAEEDEEVDGAANLGSLMFLIAVL